MNSMYTVVILGAMVQWKSLRDIKDMPYLHMYYDYG